MNRFNREHKERASRLGVEAKFRLRKGEQSVKCYCREGCDFANYKGDLKSFWDHLERRGVCISLISNAIGADDSKARLFEFKSAKSTVYATRLFCPG